MIPKQPQSKVIWQLFPCLLQIMVQSGNVDVVGMSFKVSIQECALKGRTATGIADASGSRKGNVVFLPRIDR
jgi:hypothetical protein